MFTGFNIAFFPMHLSGLMGMPRRVYTYPAVMGWDVLNMISTIGAFLFAAGIALFLIDLVRNLRPAVSNTAGNIWKAATLEWLHNDVYGPRSIPIVTSADPLWDQPRLADDVEAGRYYLPGSITGRRETIVTSPIEAAPQYLLRLPGPGWTPLLAAIFTAAFFMLLTVKAVTLALICGVLAVAMILVWMWDSDPKPLKAVDIGGGHQAADLCNRSAVAFLVGDDRAAAGRGLALSRLCVFLSLPLDGLAAVLAEAGGACAGPSPGLVGPSAGCRQRHPRRGRTCFAPQAARQSHLRGVDRPRRRHAWSQR